MNVIFYALALSFIVFELFIFLYPNSAEYAKPRLAVHLCYSIWSIVGLFGSRWEVFMFLILLGAITSIVKLSVVKQEKSINYAITRIDALLSASLLVYLFISYFYEQNV